MKGCRRARSWIERAVDGRLALEEELRLEEHLRACGDCQAFHERMATIEEALERMPEPPVERLDAERILSAVHREIALRREGDPAIPGEPRALPPILARAAAVAAVLMLLAVALHRLSSRGDGASEPVPADPPHPQTARLAPQPEPLEPGSLEIDALVPARLNEARSGVGAGLAERLGDLDQNADAGTVRARLEGFGDDLRPLVGPEWPLSRIAQGLLDAPDPRVARAAARFLGVRGDRISAGCLRDALDRRELAPWVVAALGDLGEDGLEGLSDALLRPELAPSAAVRIRGIGGPEAALTLERSIEQVARGGRRTAQGDRAELLTWALVGCGEGAVESLLHLARREALPRATVFDALGSIAGAGDSLVALARSEDWRSSRELLLDAVTELRPPAALPWLGELARSRRHRDTALACIADFRDAKALGTLLSLRTGGRLPDQPILEAARRLLGEAPGAAESLAVELVESGDAPAAASLLDLLLACEAPETGAALVRLARAELLGPDERQWAAIAVGELGDRLDVPALALRLDELGPRCHRLAAACLISVHELSGALGVIEALDAFDGIGDRSGERILAFLDEGLSKGSKASTLYRVARELEILYDTDLRNRISRAP